MNDAGGTASPQEPEGNRRQTIRRILLGATTAIVGTAAMMAITMPLSASGNDRPKTADSSASASSSDVDGTEAGNAADAAQAPGRTAEPVEPAERGTGDDPLTPAELEHAEDIALAGDRALRAKSEDVSGEEGEPEHLRTELVDDEDPGGADGDRRAEVFFYDYSKDTLVKKTVNLSSGKVEDTQKSRDTQPPPNRSEAREAAQLVIDSPQGAGLRQDFKAATGKELTDGKQLTVQGLTFAPTTQLTGALASCGEDRCVRLFTRVKDGPWIDIKHLVVNLSQRSVSRVG